MTWVGAAHVFGMVVWAGGLIGLTRILAALARAEDDPGPRMRAAGVIYRYVAAPGALIVFFTGISMLHEAPALLQQPSMQVELALVLGLFVADHLICARCR